MDQNRSTCSDWIMLDQSGNLPTLDSTPGISKDDQDLIRPGRITMKPTIEQNALVKACKPGTPLLLEDGIMEVGTMENGHLDLKMVYLVGYSLR